MTYLTTNTITAIRDEHELNTKLLNRIDRDLAELRDRWEYHEADNINEWESCSDEGTASMWKEYEQDLQAIDRVKAVSARLQEVERRRAPKIQKLIESNNRRYEESLNHG